jgi:hypothetical protein
MTVGLLDDWMANWSDLIDFEVHPVITSKEAAEKIAPRLQSFIQSQPKGAFSLS